MLHFHLRSVSNTNFTSDFFFSLTHGLIVFNFQLFERSSRFLSVTESSFNPTVITDHTFYKLNQFTFIETCLMAQKMVYLGNNSMCAWKKKKHIFNCFGVECSINIKEVKLADYTVQIPYVLTDFVYWFYHLLSEGC